MLTDQERLAIQEHVKKIEEYEAQEEKHRQQLLAPDLARYEELTEVGQKERPKFLSTDEKNEAFRIIRRVEAGIEAFSNSNKPKLKPWDTPARIIRFIEESEITLSENVFTARNRFPLDNSLLAEARNEAFNAAMTRMQAFQTFAPSIYSDLPDTADPVRGMLQIKAWCVEAMRVEGTESETQAGSSVPPLDATAYYSPERLAEIFGINKSAMRQRLDRWRKKNPSGGWMENTERLPNDPKYLFQPFAAEDVVSSSQRAAQKISSEKSR